MTIADGPRVERSEERSRRAAGEPLVLLTCRPADSDFRYHLAREMRDLGHPVTYIYMKRRPDVVDMATGIVEHWSLGRLIRFFATLRTRRPRLTVFNSTNLAFPGLSAVLRRIGGPRWCLDLHDDLLYGRAGADGLRARAELAMLLANSDIVVHAAPALRRQVPRSHHIGNGSSLQAEPKRIGDPGAVLVLASLDRRFDFALMAAAAAVCPDRRFDIHGRVSQEDAGVRADLDALVASAPNIHYHGPYTDVALPELLSRYLVAFAPYRVESGLTEYIDPLRFYHCLASATGLVSTPIPAARESGRIEMIERADELDAALDRAAAAREAGPLRTWAEVAVRLEAILWP